MPTEEVNEKNVSTEEVNVDTPTLRHLLILLLFMCMVQKVVLSANKKAT